MNGVELDTFKTLVRQHFGLEFAQQTQHRLSAALGRRMAARGLHLASAYAARLRQDAAERQALVNLLTVNETYFFREPEQLRLLIERLIPRRLAVRPAGERVRLLSAGCSSGEEVYSLIMLLAEVHGERTAELFEVLGGDVDSAILAKARAGRYGRFSFRGVSSERQSRFFLPCGADFQVKDWIRQQADFVPLNLAEPGFGLGQFDLLLYRNVSIYFDEPTRERVLRNLLRLLKPDGYLIIGSSETLGNDIGLLELSEEDGLFYFVNRRPPVTPPPPRTAPADLAGSSQPPPRIDPPRAQCAVAKEPAAPAPPAAQPPPACPTLDAMQDLIAEQRFDEALAAVGDWLALTPGDADALLLSAYLLLERRQFDQADQRVHRVLEQEPWLTDAWLLQGLVAKWQDRADPALAAFKRVVYIQPDCWPAHFHLGELYRARGDQPLAERAWSTVTRLLAEAPDPASGLRLRVLEPPAKLARHLCERHLAPRRDPRSR